MGLLALTYCVWAIATMWIAAWSLSLAVVFAAVAIAMFSSLQHEVIHGHPFRDARLNTALVFPALTLVIPYLRFRDTHLAHHQDSDLTDPYDDPESNYLHPEDWAALAVWKRRIYHANNTLLGRILIGPLVGTAHFLANEWLLARTDAKVRSGWAWHIPAAALVVLWVVQSPMPLWAYLIAAYLGLSLIRIRTFAEHQAHVLARARSVIIEDRGPLALLFLNNNLHVVHHNHPRVPWYRLPRLYRANRARYLRQNQSYFYRSYREIFRKYLLRGKDPVAHPIVGRS